MHLTISFGLGKGVLGSLLFYKFIVFFVILGVLILFPVAEHLLFPSLFASTTVIVCSIYFICVNFATIELPLSSKPLWNIESVLDFSSSYIFITGLTPVSMQVRSTTRSKSDFPKVDDFTI